MLIKFFFSSKFKDFVGLFTRLSIGIGTIFICFSVMGLLSLLGLIYFKIICSKYGIYLAWFFLSLLSISSYLMTIYSYSNSVMLFELCDSINTFRTDETYFEKFKSKITIPESKTCFYGDGELAFEFGVKNILESFE